MYFPGIDWFYINDDVAYWPTCNNDKWEIVQSVGAFAQNNFDWLPLEADRQNISSNHLAVSRLKAIVLKSESLAQTRSCAQWREKPAIAKNLDAAF